MQEVFQKIQVFCHFFGKRTAVRAGLQKSLRGAFPPGTRDDNEAGRRSENGRQGPFLKAALPYGQYDLWAYAPKTSNYCLSGIINLDHRIDPVLDLTLEKKKRFYVTGLCVLSAKNEKAAKRSTNVLTWI